MTQLATGRPGRPAASTRQAALALAQERFLAGERIDVQAIARDLGLARATMHRWFQTRDALLGETIAALAEWRVAAARSATPGGGAVALLATCDRINREFAGSHGLRALLMQEHERALRILTSSGGIVQPRVAAAVERIIDEEIAARAFSSPVASSVLAYSIVRLGEAFIYNDAVVGIKGDVERLLEVEAALLGVSSS